MESADTHLLLAMMMTMLRFYQACRKSTDTEGVERQLYLENSSGAVFNPLEIDVDVLVGGKCKGGTRNKRGAQPTTTIVLWWCTDLSYSTGKCGRTKRMLETGGTGGNEE